MGSASNPSVLCLNVTHQEANSASSPLPLWMMRTGSAASFQLSATCKTTISKKVAGMRESSTQEDLPVWHLQRALWVHAAFTTSRLTGCCTLSAGPKGSLCWSNSQPPLQLHSLGSSKAGMGHSAAGPCAEAQGCGAVPAALGRTRRNLTDPLQFPPARWADPRTDPGQFVFFLAEMSSKRKLLSQGGNSARAAHCINRTWPRVICF